MDLGNELYYYAFADLDTCRNFEMGQIPWTAIRQYCDAYDIQGDARHVMHEVIVKVDIWLLDHLSKPGKGDKGKRKDDGEASLGNPR